MKTLWNHIDSKDWREETKYKVALLILGILSAVIGFALWLIIRMWTFSTPDWLICFVGYPVVISWFVLFFYSCRHEFHDGCPRNKSAVSWYKSVDPRDTPVVDKNDAPATPRKKHAVPGNTPVSRKNNPVNEG